MSDKDWNRPDEKLPPEGVVVDTMNSHGQVTQLKRSGRLWFVPDGSMYVYYEPMFWRANGDSKSRSVARSGL